ncbi:hypothetical protein BDU57DRAFT_4672 [Ampelomyces quisqualis]|uniref:Uncharacterized protein n=1 Tax=Ampelomyces quisqualis TaxID=50730 RepID=A0A6A5QWN9_AMPQU|nr:hypothetical protein BDU57DRAFT_4672 [Ampelomyces quisqualis]
MAMQWSISCLRWSNTNHRHCLSARGYWQDAGDANVKRYAPYRRSSRPATHALPARRRTTPSLASMTGQSKLFLILVIEDDSAVRCRYAPQHMAALDEPVYLWCCSPVPPWIEFPVKALYELGKGRTAYKLSTCSVCHPASSHIASDSSRAHYCSGEKLSWRPRRLVCQVHAA